MIWKTDLIKKDPVNGAVRVKRKFAFRPVLIEDRYVFLSFYEILQVYEIKLYEVKLDDSTCTFKVGKWVTISKRICVK